MDIFFSPKGVCLREGRLYLEGVPIYPGRVILKRPFCFYFCWQNVIAWTNLGVLYLKHGKIEVRGVEILL